MAPLRDPRLPVLRPGARRGVPALQKREEMSKFTDIRVGEFFYEIDGDVPHLKTSSRHGMYQRFGTRYEPTFADAADVISARERAEQQEAVRR